MEKVKQKEQLQYLPKIILKQNVTKAVRPSSAACEDIKQRRTQTRTSETTKPVGWWGVGAAVGEGGANPSADIVKWNLFVPPLISASPDIQRPSKKRSLPVYFGLNVSIYEM